MTIPLLFDQKPWQQDLPVFGDLAPLQWSHRPDRSLTEDPRNPKKSYFVTIRHLEIPGILIHTHQIFWFLPPSQATIHKNCLVVSHHPTRQLRIIIPGNDWHLWNTRAAFECVFTLNHIWLAHFQCRQTSKNATWLQYHQQILIYQAQNLIEFASPLPAFSSKLQPSCSIWHLASAEPWKCSYPLPL